MYSIGDKIAYLRKKMGLKQEELAEKLDISRQSLLNYETEKRQIPIDILSKIASFFKIPIEAFFLDDYDEFKEVKQNNNTIKIPIISKVSAGLGIYGRDEILDWLEVSKSIAKSATFATFIDGDSMEPKIYDDDLVLVQEVSMLDSGEIGIFFLNDDVYCKKFQYNEFTKEIILKSINPKYKPKEVTSDDDFRIIGRVVAVFDYTI
ncbi:MULTISPECIES: XRE family transcriptional regulator [Fusobacterium]|uniref:XRE family transcriptional regulator n=1 Tax=Fusobacterium TaxID=848 RepID=UPI00300A2172